MNETTELVLADTDRSLSRPLTIDEVHANLEFVRNLMRREMAEGQDYGSIPGCGPKPTLLQPGAQKLLMTFNLIEEVKKEVLREYQSWHREYEFTITVRSQNGKSWDGVGTCSTLESKYRYRKAQRTCPECGKPAIIKGKKEFGGGWLCFSKKDGCGHKWPDGATEIEDQEVGQVENENPADSWNTVRKMAFKRALVAAAINATNTSELWTQDIEENGASGSVTDEYLPKSMDEAVTAPIRRIEPKQPEAPVKPVSEPQKAQKLTPDEIRDKTLEALKARKGEPSERLVAAFLVAAIGCMHPDKWPDEWLPSTPKELRALGVAIADFEAEGRAEMPYKAKNLPSSSQSPTSIPTTGGWAAVNIHTGPLRNTLLGSHPDDVIKDMWRNFKPQLVKNLQREMVPLKADAALRMALNEAAAEKGWQS